MTSHDPERSILVTSIMCLEPDIARTAGDRDSVPKYHQ